MTADKNRGSALKRLKEQLRTAGVTQHGKKTPQEKRAAISQLQRENPFEMRINRTKYQVLGRTIQGAQGQPSVSHGRALAERQKMLEQDKLMRHKRSTFVDRRFGEQDTTMSVEEKMLERFAKERQRTNVYNIDDEDHELGDRLDMGEEEPVLTHRGKAIDTERDDFEWSGDEEHDEGAESDGQIEKDVVAQTHFGGFGDEPGVPEGYHADGKKKSKSEIMREVIAKSKFHKMERQKTKEANEELCDELNEDFESIRDLLVTSHGGSLTTSTTAGSSKTAGTSSNAVAVQNPRILNLNNVKEDVKEVNVVTATVVELEEEKPVHSKSKPDAYDVLVRELVHDRRAQPTDRLKTAEELAREEADRLAELERQRLRRMQGLDSDEDQGQVYKESNLSESADRLDEKYGSRKESGQNDTLRYDEDGNLVQGIDFAIRPMKRRRLDDKSDGSISDDLDGDETDEESDESEDDSDSDSDGTEVSEDDSESNQSESVYSLDQDGFETDSSEETNAVTENNELPQQKSTKSDELPFTFQMPKTSDELKDLLDGHSVTNLDLILQRLRTCHHVSLHPENKAKLSQLIPHLFAFMASLCDTNSLSPMENVMALLDVLMKHVAALATTVPDAVYLACRENLVQLHQQYQDNLNQNGLARWPLLSQLIPVIAILRLYSTSDSRHVLVTPCLVLLTRLLFEVPVRRVSDVASQLFVVASILDALQESKRFVPECLTVTMQIICALKQKSLPVATWCASSWSNTVRQALCSPVDGNVTNNSLSLMSLVRSTRQLDMTQMLSVRQILLASSLKCLKSMIEMWQCLPAFVEMMKPVQSVIVQLDSTAEQVSLMKVLESALSQAESKLQPLRLQRHKAVALASYAPKFEEQYSLDKRRRATGDGGVSRLKSQVKREYKGTLRELRRDASFLATSQIESRRQADSRYETQQRSILGRIGEEAGEAKKEKRNARRS